MHSYVKVWSDMKSTESLRGCLHFHLIADINVTFNAMYSVKQNSSECQVSK